MVVSNTRASVNDLRPEDNLLHPRMPSEKTNPPPSPPSSSSASTQNHSSTNDRSTSSDTSAGIAIVISPPIPLSESPPSFHDAIAVPQALPTQNANADYDVVQYNLIHGRGDTAVVRRLPENFPSYAHSFTSSNGPPESLPAYGTNEPPRYTRYAHESENGSEEPQTLSRLFFKFGFFFPGFWFFGALMLITPFRTCNPLERGRQWSLNLSFTTWRNEHLETDEEKAEFIAKFRAAERRWAKRCLLASFLMACFGIAFGAMIYGVMKSTSARSPVNGEPSSGTWTL